MYFKRIGDHDLPLPKRATEGSAGLDLQSASRNTILIEPGCRAIIPTGWSFCFSLGSCGKGLTGLIWPRSGLAVKHGIDVLAGCIDSDYRKEVGVVLVNHGDQPFHVNYGDRIAQLLVMPIVYFDNLTEVEWDDWEQVGNSERSGGFGSTGTG